jgi:hypothetical protein
MSLALLFEPILARGGGGGSGGSGGGGGGIIFLLGYLPSHAVGAVLRKKMHNPIGMIVTFALTIVYAGAWFFIGGSLGFIVGIAALIGGPSGYFGWLGKAAGITKRSKVAKQALQTAAQVDPAWDQTALDQRLQEIFMQYQTDWSNFNTENMKQYLTPRNWQYNYLMMLAIQQRQRRNNVDQPKILELTPVAVVDNPGIEQDSITYYIRAQADDQLIDTTTNQLLFVDNNVFEEYWTMTRSDSGWLLDGIEQSTANPLSNNEQVRALATQNGYYYSIDWGWLLLPQRGQLFKGGKFGKSDINNHVIGVYRNVLIEIYSYIPSLGQSNSSRLVIAQAALPKRYDSLIVEAKTKFSALKKTPNGYNKLSLEWPDFNRRYNVYATNAEQVTAFELLHPVYMEKLFALDFKVSIEVVDNVVYLYSSDNNANYDTMLALLKDAFEEMKL